MKLIKYPSKADLKAILVLIFCFLLGYFVMVSGTKSGGIILLTGIIIWFLCPMLIIYFKNLDPAWIILPLLTGPIGTIILVCIPKKEKSESVKHS